MLSAADRAGPGHVLTCPAGSDITCWPSATWTVGIRSASPSSTIARAPSPVSPAGWKSTTSARPALPAAGEQLRRAGEARHVHVVAAGVHHRQLVALGVGGGHLAGVGQPGRLLHRQRVHVRPQQHSRARAVAQHPDHSGAAHPLVNGIAGSAQPLREQSRRPVLLVRELGVSVDVPVQLLLPRPDVGQTGQNPGRGGVRCHRSFRSHGHAGSSSARRVAQGCVEQLAPTLVVRFRSRGHDGICRSRPGGTGRTTRWRVLVP